MSSNRQLNLKLKEKVKSGYINFRVISICRVFKDKRLSEVTQKVNAERREEVPELSPGTF